MQGLILEGTTEDSVRLSDDVELVGSLEPRQVRVEVRAAGARLQMLLGCICSNRRSLPCQGRLAAPRHAWTSQRSWHAGRKATVIALRIGQLVNKTNAPNGSSAPK